MPPDLVIYGFLLRVYFSSATPTTRRFRSSLYFVRSSATVALSPKYACVDKGHGLQGSNILCRTIHSASTMLMAREGEEKRIWSSRSRCLVSLRPVWETAANTLLSDRTGHSERTVIGRSLRGPEKTRSFSGLLWPSNLRPTLLLFVIVRSYFVSFISQQKLHAQLIFRSIAADTASGIFVQILGPSW
jgi:hypothetical protein